MNEKSLSIAFCDSLNEETIACVSELAEIGLDAIMDDALLKEVPILSTAIAIYKICGSLKERHNIKKLIAFLNEINKGIIDEQKRLEYQQKFKREERFRDQEIEYLLVLIDRYISYDKPKMLAKLFLAYLDGTILWEELTMYAEVIDRFLLLDYQTLLSGDGITIVHRNLGGESVLRLVALGLMTECTDTSPFIKTKKGYGLTWGSLTRSQSLDKTYIRTEFGDKLVAILK